MNTLFLVTLSLGISSISYFSNATVKSQRNLDVRKLSYQYLDKMTKLSSLNPGTIETKGLPGGLRLLGWLIIEPM